MIDVFKSIIRSLHTFFFNICAHVLRVGGLVVLGLPLNPVKQGQLHRTSQRPLDEVISVNTGPLKPQNSHRLTSYGTRMCGQQADSD